MSEDIFNKKNENLTVLETVFVDYIEKKCWLVSDKEKRPLSPKTMSSAWGIYENLSTFQEACEFITANPTYQIALVPKAAGLIVVDLDKIKSVNEPIPEWTNEIVAKFATYAELSQTETGIHLILKGKTPGERVKGIFKGYSIEFLCHHPVTCTGKIIENFRTINSSEEELLKIYHQVFPQKEKPNSSAKQKTPRLSNEKIIAKCNSAKNREKFIKLFCKGSLEDYNGDHSAADFALASIFAFYTQDPNQIFELIQKSALYSDRSRKEKWQRPDYKKNTIERAIQSCTEFYGSTKSEKLKATWNDPLPINKIIACAPDFPVEVFPRSMQQAMLEIERFVQVDPCLAAIPILGLTALQIGKKVLIEEKPGLNHYPSLFLLAVMDHVERKSQICNTILDPFKDAIEEELEKYQKDFTETKAHNESIKEQVASVKSKIRSFKSSGDLSIEQLTKELESLLQKEKELPAHPKNWGDDLTPARIQQQLHAHKGVFGLFSSEGRTLLSRIQNKHGTEDVVSASLYTAMTWGDDIDSSRVGRDGVAEERNVRKPAATIMTFVQRDFWKDFSRDKTMRQNGTISRICIVSPLSRAGSRFEKETDEPFKREEIMTFIKSVIRIRKWLPEKGLTVKFSPDAARARRDFYNEIEKELGPDGIFVDVRDIAGRACSLATRLAGIFAIYEAAERGNLPQNNFPDITEERWLRAQALEEYFLYQAVDSQLLQGISGPEHLAEKIDFYLYKHLDKEGSRIRLSILPSKVRAWRDTEDDQRKQAEALKILEEACHLRKTTEPINRGKGYWYEINPKIKTLDQLSDDKDA